MKKIVLLGSMLGAGLLQLLAHGGGWKAPSAIARHWHNPADPVQAARIKAAAAKRERKADNAQHYAMRSDVFNTAHRQYAANFESLTSTFVAK